MTEPLVTIGVPVYRGQDALPALLECLRTQTYKNLDVLVSVDAADEESAAACEPFLRQDSRFRVHVHPSRLGWAGNTDWTMWHRHGDFWVYQQHDDLLSPTYIADLVAASFEWPDAVLCFAKLQFTGTRHDEIVSPSLLGDPVTRVLTQLRKLDWVPFRGLIRGSALDKTAGLLLSDFDPYDSLGTEYRFMQELAFLGEFRFVEGPTYFKSSHGENLSKKRHRWSKEHVRKANACFAAWMIEVMAPAGASVWERRRLFKAVLQRFAGSRRDPLGRLRSLLRAKSSLLRPARVLAGQLKKSEKVTAAVQAADAMWGLRDMSPEERDDFLQQIYARLKQGGRFGPACLDMTWDALQSRYFGPTA